MCVRCAMFMHKGTLFLRPARSLMGTCRQKEVSIPTKTYMQSEIFPPKNIYRLMDGYRQTGLIGRSSTDGNLLACQNDNIWRSPHGLAFTGWQQVGLSGYTEHSGLL